MSRAAPICRRPRVGPLLAVLLPWVAGVAVAADPAAAHGQGERLYEIYCAHCHGERGRGDGAAARSLEVRPADLTRLADDGEQGFPANRVFRRIDGRDRAGGEVVSRMPIFGLSLQELDRDVNQEAEVRWKIRQLVRYLASLQREPS